MFTTNKAEKEKIRIALEKTEKTNTKTQALQKDISVQNKQIQKQQAFLDDLSKKQAMILEQFSTELHILQQTNKTAQAEVHNLKSAKINIETSIAQNFQQQTSKALQQIENTAKVDTRKVEELTQAFHDVIQQLKDAKKTIHQFHDLAQTIKETDYQIKEHAKALTQVNNEKLHLLKRVDELEGMLAKFKRPKRGPMF